MSAAAESFLDTNILLYLLSADERKADLAEEIVAEGGVISVQVLNEFASVATRKLGMSIPDVVEVLRAARTMCRVVALDEATHDLGLRLAERYGLSIYDATIAAAADLAGCRLILSEDLQDGLRVEGRLRVRNPFRR